MGLYEKIEEIRSKPEHIRMRYVWAMVAITMLFVLVIWFFSLKSGQAADPIIPSAITNSDAMSQLQQQKDSLQNTANGIANAMQNGSSSDQSDANNNQ
jgi:urea transporter